jgi:homoserine O-acetyltransferase
MTLRLAALAVAALFALAAPAFAYDGLVEKKTFAMKGPYRTLGGAEIAEVKVGYETIGTLNAAGDNAILIPHFYSGNSHFAGRYKEDDKVRGYWDGIVGPGKPLDTEKYFLVGVDSLCNLNTRDGVTVTTGPASIDPGTGKPYGRSFPPVEMGDFVQVQKALLEALGVKRLHAVMGASMGALQSWDWAARHPDFVPRIVSVIGAPAADAYSIMLVGTWADAIKADPAWNAGDYYGKAEPVAGLAMAFKLVNLNARAPAWASQAFGRKPAESANDPKAAWSNAYAIEQWNDAAAASRAKITDANHFLCLAKANQTFVLGSKETLEEGLAAVKAKALILPAKGDLLLFPALSRQARDILEAQGKRVEYQELEGPLGHLDGVVGIAQAAPAITRFLGE